MLWTPASGAAEIDDSSDCSVQVSGGEHKHERNQEREGAADH